MNDTRASEAELTAIIESAIRLRIPPLFFEILLNKLHQLSELDARLLIGQLQVLAAEEESLRRNAQKLEAFWQRLSSIIDSKLHDEVELIENEVREELLGEFTPKELIP